ncbi:hypothetical protein F4808DRAFT_458094 [Astrocystis sublimbata]|nr:hypothetical protein F4808DRAFT_458094 [Astrocystis sublimbata]
MSKIIDDVKTGVKGIRGAGDAIRGNLMQATDQAFDNNQNHPQTQASELKNEALAHKGKGDMQAVDDRLASREHERAARKTGNLAGAGATNTHATGVNHGLAHDGVGAGATTNNGTGVNQGLAHEGAGTTNTNAAGVHQGLAHNGAGATTGAGHHPQVSCGNKTCLEKG